MNNPKKISSTFLLMLVSCLLLTSCGQDSEHTNNKRDQMLESKTNGEDSHKDEEIKSKEVLPKEKKMGISKEGMTDSIMATFYRSPKDSPLQFTLYYPSELEVERISSEGHTLNFIRNEANLQLHLFPPEIDSEEQAMNLIREKIEPLGEITENNNSYRLAPNAKISSFIELFERDGVFYYWWSKYPVEYADGFGAEIYFIKKNLEWESRFDE